MDDEKQTIAEKWYVLHTYSGHEYKVQKLLGERAESLGVKESILEILVPNEEKIEIKRNKRQIVQKKCFPGYVMVKVLVTPIESNIGLEYKMDNKVWYVIRNTEGVSGFVGTGYYPTPLSEAEADNIKSRMKRYSDAPKVDIDVKKGDTVEIINGSFMGSYGKIDEIDHEHGKLKIMVDVFNRMTPVEVGFDEVRPL